MGRQRLIRCRACLPLVEQASQPLLDPADQGHGRQPAHKVEQAVEQGQLKHRLPCQPQQTHQTTPEKDHRHNDDRGQQLEQEIAQRQPATIAGGSHRGNQGRRRGAYIGADTERQGMGQRHQPAIERHQHQHQQGVTRLGQRRQENAGQHTTEHTMVGRQPGQIAGTDHPVANVVDAQQQKADTEQDRATATGAWSCGLQLDQGAQHQHGHGVMADRYLHAIGGNQPDPEGGAQSRAYDQRQTGTESDDTGTDKRDSHHGTEGTRLEHTGRNYTGQPAAPALACRVSEHMRQAPATDLTKALFQAQHAKKKQRQTGEHDQHLGREPQAEEQQGRNHGEKKRA